MLWIATQDDKSLLSVKEVTVNKKRIIGVIDSTSTGDWSKYLGKYDSNERALEILNEIFKKIEDSSGIPVTFIMPKR